ncbi:MAG: hypothetical protein QOI12_4854 [Alphaproteobacteria bacterium]|jgi:uncharacterized iron-regulated membrane protein|nr:hypothetical protein [Alphaproteobacteria bacterium]
MMKHLLRFVDGVHLLRQRDTGYFTTPDGAARRSRFREDVHAMVGGAIAAAFIAAVFANFVPNEIISDGALTTIAAFVGAFIGKLTLI